MPNLVKIAQQNKEAVEAEGWSECPFLTTECRVINNLIASVNLQNKTSFAVIPVIPISRPDSDEIIDVEYLYYVEDCDTRGVPNVIDASLSYRIELIGMWFIPTWMVEIATLVLMPRRAALHPVGDFVWAKAVAAFYKGLLGDLEAVNTFIAGEVLMAEAQKELGDSGPMMYYHSISIEVKP